MGQHFLVEALSDQASLMLSFQPLLGSVARVMIAGDELIAKLPQVALTCSNARSQKFGP